MGIVNTLAKCLDSPYLFADAEAKNRIGGLLAMAGDRLEAASNLQSTGQGDPADVTFLCYEAMFSCIRALVYAKGYREAGLRCLLLACETIYVRPGLLDVEFLHAFERIQGLKASPEDSLASASALIKRTLQLLAQ
ncbi:HEPN domain-containing protein [Isosphaeraceae bacterium EP7]